MARLVPFLFLVAGLAGCSQPPAQPQSRAVKPVSDLSRMEETGRRLYASTCAFCHGIEGDGFGINAPNLPVPPRNHTDANYMNNLTGQQLSTVIKFGGTARGRTAFMPPWGDRFSDREIAALVAYLRSLARPGSSKPG